MTNPAELYLRHSASFDKLHTSEKEDELVDRIAEAIRHCYSDDALPVDRPSVVAARAALAAARPVIRNEVLEEAAMVADDEGGYCEDTGSAPSDFGNAGRNDAARNIAAAIRALKEKE